MHSFDFQTESHLWHLSKNRLGIILGSKSEKLKARAFRLCKKLDILIKSEYWGNEPSYSCKADSFEKQYICFQRKPEYPETVIPSFRRGSANFNIERYICGRIMCNSLSSKKV